MQIPLDLFKALTGCANAATSGKRGSARVEMTADVFVFPIARSKSKPAELAEVRDVSRTGAAILVSPSPELAVGRRLALRLVTQSGDAVLLHCEICRTYPVDRDRMKLGLRFLHLLKDCRPSSSAA